MLVAPFVSALAPYRRKQSSQTSHPTLVAGVPAEVKRKSGENPCQSVVKTIGVNQKGMCGIVGYVGNKQVVPLIIDGLRKLEYRGYDSAGIAVVNENHDLEIRRAEGKLRNLEETIRLSPLDGTYGIGHTRWATHGRPLKRTPPITAMHWPRVVVTTASSKTISS